jgi:2-octaprenyl-6-methoxyphenol hydroxylase
MGKSRVKAVHTVNNFAHIRLENNDKNTCLTADLAILAEGGASIEIAPNTNKYLHDYHQVALTADISFSEPSSDTAYEYFSTYGPFALLPYNGHYRLLWIRNYCDQILQDKTPQRLSKQLQEILNNRFGKIQAIQITQQFALSLKEVRDITKGRIAFIGAAAQALHPIAGQGLNLGLRDAQYLLASLTRYQLNLDFGVALKDYKKTRRLDRLNTIAFTHFLAKLSHNPKSAWLRGLGMNCLELSSALRKRFIMQMVFGIPHQDFLKK